MIYWIIGTYLIGSFAGYILGRDKQEVIIDATIQSLMDNGFLRYRKTTDGETEIMKWNEHGQ